MSRPKILLVDDTKLFLELEKNFLKLTSAIVLTAGDGAEALKVARSERPDLIFMDLNMPVMDGLTCCAAIKGDPQLRSIPVIMVTSAGKDEDVRLCRQAGCDDHLTKPINRKVFLEKGRKFLNDIERRETRVGCQTAVKFRVHKLHLSGVSADISGKGIYIATEYEIDEKTPLDLSFTLPDSDCIIDSVAGRVAWQNTREKHLKPQLPVGFGVEFLGLSEEKAELISAYVAVKLGQG